MAESKPVGQWMGRTTCSSSAGACWAKSQTCLGPADCSSDWHRIETSAQWCCFPSSCARSNNTHGQPSEAHSKPANRWISTTYYAHTLHDQRSAQIGCARQEKTYSIMPTERSCLPILKLPCRSSCRFWEREVTTPPAALSQHGDDPKCRTRLTSSVGISVVVVVHEIIEPSHTDRQSVEHARERIAATSTHIHHGAASALGHLLGGLLLLTGSRLLPEGRVWVGLASGGWGRVVGGVRFNKIMSSARGIEDGVKHSKRIIAHGSERCSSRIAVGWSWSTKEAVKHGKRVLCKCSHGLFGLWSGGGGGLH